MKTSEEKRIMRLCCILLLTILFLCASGPAALSEKGISSSRADQILGVWSGSYPGSETDGEGNALTRETTIRIRSLDADTGAFYGILEYVVPGFRDGLFGSYYIRGSVNTSDWSYTLQGYQMIVDDGYYDHGSYTVYSGRFDWTNGKMISETYDFELTKTGDFEGSIRPADLPGTYVGQHYGSVSGTGVLRNSHLIIESVSASGIAAGKFQIYRRENAANQITGSYRWTGWIDLCDGRIEFQGTDWVFPPDVPDNYVFQQYVGTVDAAAGTITGTNGNGPFVYEKWTSDKEQGRYAVTTGTWSGNYMGVSASGVVTKQLTLHIDRVYEDGTFEGIAEIFSDAPGSYFFEGTCAADGSFSFQGTEWIESPGPGHVCFRFNGMAADGIMTGTVENNSSPNDFLFAKVSEEYKSYRIDLNQIPRTWKGEYDGFISTSSQTIVVRRNLAFHINTISPDGVLLGTAELTPSPSAPAEYGSTGSYYFRATVSERAGTIQFQGTQWTVQPTGYSVFVAMTGRISTDYTAIEGTTEYGIWSMKPAEDAAMSLYIDSENVLHRKNGNRYRVYSLPGAAWTAVKNYCKKQGGHLATLTSQAENDDVYGYLRFLGCDSAYFGLTDEKKEGVWRWVTGEKLVYTNWHSGEPDNQGGIEHYAMFCPEYTNGQWNDGDFSTADAGGQIAFICEWDAKKTDWAFILPENLTVIQKEAFAGIAAESVKIPSGCTTISSRAFANASLRDIYIPASVDSIADDAFAKGVTIWTPAGSPAAVWGKTYGYTVIETED